MTDPIADMLTRIRNAYKVKKQDVIVPFSKVKFEIAKILKHENFIENVEKVDEIKPEIKLVLRYDQENKPAIENIKRISKPGLRVYVGKDNLPVVLDNLGVAIISTSSGLMTNKQAKREKVGGEVICEVY